MRAPTDDDIAIISRDAPQIFTMVAEAKKEKVKNVLFMIDAFAYEPELLHAAVWYITSSGLICTIAGESDRL